MEREHPDVSRFRVSSLNVSSLHVVVLAAGKGMRMQSPLPKVLQPLGGRFLLSHVLETARSLRPERLMVVTGHESDQVRAAVLSDAAHQNPPQLPPIEWVFQPEPKGTGDALKCVLNTFPETSGARVLILYGDVPFIREETLRDFITQTDPQAFGIMTALFSNPTGLGRIIRGASGTIERIVEEKDASPVQKQVTEVNTGIFLLPGAFLKNALPDLSPQNAKNEYYLTDLLSMASQAGMRIQEKHLPDPTEVLGANDRLELARLEQAFQRRMRENFIRQGVLFQDPDRVYFRGKGITIGQQVSMDVDVVLEGPVWIGDGADIGPFVRLKNVRLAEGVRVLSHSVLEDTNVGAFSTVGPFARTRGGVELGASARVGNFVEIKKSVIGEGSKIAHLSYIGDATLGQHVNWGAGAITCNYNGRCKNPTWVGDHCFVGSNAVLVAPVTLASRSFVGAGSTITRDVPSEALAVSRSPQKHIEHWVVRFFSKEDSN